MIDRAALNRFRKERIDRQYRELRVAAPELFNACVQMAEGIVFNRVQPPS